MSALDYIYIIVRKTHCHRACLGEIHEYKEDLASLDKSKKKDAVKKVIAAMTVGKDVSMLFPHVVNCMQTDDLELKKLVYLYLINYAKTQPDLAIMGVNTFVKVSYQDLLISAGLAKICLLHHINEHEAPWTRWQQTVVRLSKTVNWQSEPITLPALGHTRPKPLDTCPGSPYHGMHQSGQDHRVLV